MTRKYNIAVKAPPKLVCKKNTTLGVQHLGVQIQHLGVQIQYLGVQIQHLGVQIQHLGVQIQHLGVQIQHSALPRAVLASQLAPSCCNFRTFMWRFFDYKYQSLYLYFS